MNIEHIYYLNKIVETRSISLAANKLFMSQQNLSTIVANLEKRFGCTIFHRSKKGTYLTEDGKILLEKLNTLTNVYEDCLNTFLDVEKPIPISLHSLLFPDTATCAQLLSINTPNEIIVREQDSPDDIFHDVETRQALFGATLYYHDYASETHEHVDVSSVYTSTLCAIVPMTHKLAGRASLTIEECLSYPIVLESDDVIRKHILDYYIQKNALSPNYHVAMVVATYKLLETVVKTNGLTFSSLWNRARNLAPSPLDFIPIEDSELVHILILTQKDRILSANENALIRAAESLLEQLQNYAE